jgi:hypothetical protein
MSDDKLDELLYDSPFSEKYRVPLEYPEDAEDFRGFNLYESIYGIQQNLLQRDSEESTEPIVNNPFIKKEKERIARQEVSNDYLREDHFSIGTVYFKIPPMQISITEEKHNFRYNSLRSKGETVVTSGRSTIRIDLDIIFNGIDDINSKLRSLLAQFKTSPFLPIENEYISNVLNPFKMGLSFKEELDSRKEQIEKLKKGEELVNDLLKLTSENDEGGRKRFEILEKLRKDGHLSQENYAKITGEYLWRPENIAKQDLNESDYIVNDYGEKEFSFSKWITRYIEAPSKNKDNMISINRSLSELKKLENELSIIKKRAAALQSKAIDERFNDKQMAGVLSQISVSTVPGYPEMIGCRISMYIFNYDTYSQDFAFIDGNSLNGWTTDICRCDLFIDWYTRRFLSERDGHLAEIKGDQSTYFVYTENIDFDTSKPKWNFNDNNLNFVNISSEGSYVSGITVSFKNIIQFLPILSHKVPTCQYLGSLNTDVQINLEVTSRGKLNEISKMIDKVGQVSRYRNRVTKNAFLLVSNEILAMCGLDTFLIEAFSVDTIPNNPGTFSVGIALSEYRIGREKPKIKPKDNDGLKIEDIKAISEIWMDSARQYIGDPGNYPELRKYADEFLMSAANIGSKSIGVPGIILDNMPGSQISIDNYIKKYNKFNKDFPIGNINVGEISNIGNIKMPGMVFGGA